MPTHRAKTLARHNTLCGIRLNVNTGRRVAGCRLFFNDIQGSYAGPIDTMLAQMGLL